MRSPWLFLPCLLTLAGIADANTPEIVADTAERHVRQQLQNLPGKISITISPLDTSRLPPCTAFEAYTPAGGRLIGRTQIGVRCLGPSTFTVLVSAQIAVTGNYVTTSKALRGGQVIEAGDIIVASGDIGNLPSGFVQDAAPAGSERQGNQYRQRFFGYGGGKSCGKCHHRTACSGKNAVRTNYYRHRSRGWLR